MSQPTDYIANPESNTTTPSHQQEQEPPSTTSSLSFLTHTWNKISLYYGASLAIFAKLISSITNLMVTRDREKSINHNFATIRTHPLISTKRLILIRHSESVWNDTVMGVKRFYRCEMKRWVRIWGYLFREVWYFPTTKSLYFDTPLTLNGLDLCLSFHDWLNTTQPEIDLKGNNEALLAVALLRGPHWKPEEEKEQKQQPSQHPSTIPATLVTSHLRRTILTLSLILQTRLGKHYEQYIQSYSTQFMTPKTKVINPLSLSSISTSTLSDEMTTLRNRNDQQLLTKSASTSSSSSSSSSTTTTTTTTSTTSQLPSRSNFEQIYINSNCKEMSTNIDCISLTKVGDLPCFSNDDSTGALSYFTPSTFSSLRSTTTPHSNDTSVQNSTINSISEPEGIVKSNDDASVDVIKNNGDNNNNNNTTTLSMEQILSLSCDMSNYTSVGASTKMDVLDGFGDYIFNHHNDNFIICGHSSWFRNFYHYFIPNLPSPTSSSNNNNNNQADGGNVDGYDNVHIANVIQKKKMDNAACYTVLLNHSIDPTTQKGYYWIDPDHIVAIWRGFE